jgi:hypothetical protein
LTVDGASLAPFRVEARLERAYAAGTLEFASVVVIEEEFALLLGVDFRFRRFALEGAVIVSLWLSVVESTASTLSFFLGAVFSL